MSVQEHSLPRKLLFWVRSLPKQEVKRFLEALTIGWLLLQAVWMAYGIILAKVKGKDRFTLIYNNYGEHWLELIFFTVIVVMGTILLVTKVRRFWKA